MMVYDLTQTDCEYFLELKRKNNRITAQENQILFIEVFATSIYPRKNIEIVIPQCVHVCE